MSTRARQLTSLWLALVLALLPVSGSLLAAASQPQTGDPGASAMQAHHGGMGHGAHHPDHHGPDASGAEHSPVPAATHPHDCHSSLCAGGCGGCGGCHAPPSGVSGHSSGASVLSVALLQLTSAPPPGALDRPPQRTTA
ncbi:MAG: hypothetical protein ABR558_09285 [Thioalkalivibrio sp.]